MSMPSEILSNSLIFSSSNYFRQSSPIGDPKMRSSSFVFMFILGLIFRNCVKIELYCVLVVGPKKTKFAPLSVQAQAVNLFRFQNVFKEYNL